jgi:hypothetical protein
MPASREMDADYLKATVGDALAAALTSLALKQPKDPVDFVGSYLIKYADHLEAEGKVRTHTREALDRGMAPPAPWGLPRCCFC